LPARCRAALGRWLESKPRLWKLLDRVVNRGRRVQTGTIRWFLPLYAVAGLRRYDAARCAITARLRIATPGSIWHAPPRAATMHWPWTFWRRAGWSRAIPTRMRAGNPSSIRFLAAARRLNGRPDAAQWVRRLRQAALLEEDDAALKGALATIGTFT